MSVKKFLQDKGVEEKIILAGVFSSANVTMSAIMLASVAIDFASEFIQRSHKAELNELKKEKESLQKINNILVKINDNNEGSITLSEAKDIRKDTRFILNNLKRKKYDKLNKHIELIDKELLLKISKNNQIRPKNNKIKP